MVSKNNTREIIKKESNRGVRYSIKKLAFGAASVAVATTIAFTAGSSVHAETTNSQEKQTDTVQDAVVINEQEDAQTSEIQNVDNIESTTEELTIEEKIEAKVEEISELEAQLATVSTTDEKSAIESQLNFAREELKELENLMYGDNQDSLVNPEISSNPTNDSTEELNQNEQMQEPVTETEQEQVVEKAGIPELAVQLEDETISQEEKQEIANEIKNQYWDFMKKFQDKSNELNDLKTQLEDASLENSELIQKHIESIEEELSQLTTEGSDYSIPYMKACIATTNDAYTVDYLQRQINEYENKPLEQQDISDESSPIYSDIKNDYENQKSDLLVKIDAVENELTKNQELYEELISSESHDTNHDLLNIQIGIVENYHDLAILRQKLDQLESTYLNNLSQRIHADYTPNFETTQKLVDQDNLRANLIDKLNGSDESQIEDILIEINRVDDTIYQLTIDEYKHQLSYLYDKLETSQYTDEIDYIKEEIEIIKNRVNDLHEQTDGIYLTDEEYLSRSSRVRFPYERVSNKEIEIKLLKEKLANADESDKQSIQTEIDNAEETLLKLRLVLLHDELSQQEAVLKNEEKENIATIYSNIHFIEGEIDDLVNQLEGADVSGSFRMDYMLKPSAYERINKLETEIEDLNDYLLTSNMNEQERKYIPEHILEAEVEILSLKAEILNDHLEQEEHILEIAKNLENDVQITEVEEKINNIKTELNDIVQKNVELLLYRQESLNDYLSMLKTSLEIDTDEEAVHTREEAVQTRALIEKTEKELNEIEKQLKSLENGENQPASSSDDKDSDTTPLTQNNPSEDNVVLKPSIVDENDEIEVLINDEGESVLQEDTDTSKEITESTRENESIPSTDVEVSSKINAVKGESEQENKIKSPTEVETSSQANSVKEEVTAEGSTIYTLVDSSANIGKEAELVTVSFLDEKPENVEAVEVTPVRDDETNREFDISFMDKDGNVVKTNGRVQVTLPTDGKPVEYVYHMVDGVAEKVENITLKSDHVEFVTDDFSVYGLKFAQKKAQDEVFDKNKTNVGEEKVSSTQNTADSKNNNTNVNIEKQNNESKPVERKQQLPATGESTYLLFGTAATSILAGLGMIPRRKEQ